MVLVFFVEKKNGKKQIVQDYRYLNEWTIKNNYPLLLISDIVKNIGTKKVFTKIDLRQRYNNVQIKKGDEQKVAFIISEGSFKLMVMFFGLTNSPVTFQIMMNKLLRDLINIEKVVVFIDNVIIETESEERYDKLVAEVIKRLEENDLYMKLEKYKWKVREVEFLEVVIGKDRIKMEEKKVKDILDQLTPKCIKDVQKFLELANYYRQFIEDFTFIAKPLHNIVRKDQKWDWTEKQEEAFRKFKEQFTKELVLAALDLDKKK